MDANAKLKAKRQKLGMIEVRSLWLHPDDKEAIRTMVAHLNFVRFGITNERRDDGIDKVTITNNSGQSIKVAKITAVDSEAVFAQSRYIASGRTAIYHKDDIK